MLRIYGRNWMYIYNAREVRNHRNATRKCPYLHLVVLVPIDVEFEAHVGIGKLGFLPFHPNQCFIHVKDYCALIYILLHIKNLTWNVFCE